MEWVHGIGGCHPMGVGSRAGAVTRVYGGESPVRSQDVGDRDSHRLATRSPHGRCMAVGAPGGERTTMTNRAATGTDEAGPGSGWRGSSSPSSGHDQVTPDQ